MTPHIQRFLLLAVASMALAPTAQAYPPPYDKSLRLQGLGAPGTTLDGYAGHPYSWTVQATNPYQYWSTYSRPDKPGFRFVNMGTNKCLDGYPGVDNSNVNPYQWECNVHNMYQYWILDSASPKPGYRLRNAVTGRCLEAGPLGGAALQKECDSANAKQRWLF